MESIRESLHVLRYNLGSVSLLNDSWKIGLAQHGKPAPLTRKSRFRAGRLQPFQKLLTKY